MSTTTRVSGLTRQCDRCGGPMEHMRDLYGEYDDCLLCGYHFNKYEEGPPVVLKEVSALKAPRKPRAKARIRL